MNYGWRLELECWQRLRVAIETFRWQRVYLELDYARQVPKTAGVYLICARAKEVPISGTVMKQLYNTVYVGQTIQLKRRFKDHINGYGNVRNALKIFKRLDFWYSELNADSLDEIEQLLIDAFGPAANINNVKAKLGNPVPAGTPIGGAT